MALKILEFAFSEYAFESLSDFSNGLLDNQVYITADARIDARDQLIPKLRAQGCSVTSDLPDVALILHAYQVWGEACLEHLLGDFAFVIWDGIRQRLLAVRDRFGLRPLYYAYLGHTLVFSNSIRCVQCHPHSDSTLK